MKDARSIMESAREVIRVEARAVAALESRLDEGFARAVDLLHQCKGRVIVTGVGKSGIIARKIVATLNSTGTPSLFLHPGDAVHGDLGMVRQDDVVVCISKSGDTAELQKLLPMFRRLDLPLISIVGNRQSVLARASTVTLDALVEEEACPHDLAPTSSTTASLVLGDALAVALLRRRGFSRDQFALFHPGGVLGRRLLLRVDEIMTTGDAIPTVKTGVPLRDAIMEMTSKRLGCTCVVEDDGSLAGIITDGDLRRLLQKTPDVTHTSAEAVMTRHPRTIRRGTLAVAALQEMESFNITQIIIVDEDSRPVGVIHLHDLVKLGLGGEESS
ncbi:MAG: KpsF/GutQ family sugar-phosphate isomerase [Bacteroidota bacterium]